LPTRAAARAFWLARPRRHTGERTLVARRLEAARVLAGRPSLRVLATQTGMSYRHLVGVANGHEPLLPTDARDLATALGVPSEWLRNGWPAPDSQ
jgi:hypothetical protein